jgi:alpha-mannosidase
MPPLNGFVISHTHWDREWYQPFQEFRVRLVRMMDRLLDLLASKPDFGFMLDGQTIALEDYLAICPDRAAEVRQHVRAGRLLIGPWYTLPDEFLAHPESLIRNLLFGQRVARQFGAPMPVGYIPDTFGHISQLAQIFAGFGIDNAVIWRGLPPLPNEFWWQAPDGTTALAINLREGYGNFAWAPNDPDGFASAARRAAAELASHATTASVLLMDGTDHLEARPELPELIAAANARLRDEMRLTHASLPEFIAAIRAARPRLQTVSGEFRSPIRANILPGVLSTRMWIKQRNRASEILLTRWAEPFSAIAAQCNFNSPQNVSAASRDGLLRAAWKLLLENQPHDSICGCSVDQVHEEMRARFDQVEQIGEQVARQSLCALVEQIDAALPGASEVARADARLLQPAPAIPIVIFNPIDQARVDNVTVQVQIPPDWMDYELVHDAGQSAPHQVLRRRSLDFATLGIDREGILDRVTAEFGERINGQGIISLEYREENGPPIVTAMLGAHALPERAQVLAALAEIRARLAGRAPRIDVSLAPSVEMTFGARVPACGYATYWLRRLQVAAATRNLPWQVNPAGAGCLGAVVGAVLTVATRIENAFFHVEANRDDGTLTVRDRRTGIEYRGWNRFEDEGDRGDLYNFCPVERDTFVNRPAEPPTISVIENGPARHAQRLEIKMRYRIPMGLDDTRRARSAETLDLPIVTRVSLFDDVPRIDVETTIENHACDHRLRVAFPSPVRADSFRTETPFDIVERPLDLPHDTRAWQEQPVPTHPQLTFADVSDARSGLLLANRGMPEIEARREGNGIALVLTLLRAVGWLSRDDLSIRAGHAGPGWATPGAQCLGIFTFSYALVPHAEEWHDALPQAAAFNAPLRAIVTELHAGKLPPRQSFVSVSPGAICISAIKLAETGHGMIVRVWNTTAESVEATLRVGVPFKRAQRVALSEGVIEPLAPDAEGALHLLLRPKQIQTIFLESKSD